MDAKFISRIFKPFEQESQDITKQYGGSGLGISILLGFGSEIFNVAVDENEVAV